MSPPPFREEIKMGKYFGKIGFAVNVETSPGINTEQIVEKEYFGDVLKFGRRLQQGGEIHDGIEITNVISILGDPYAVDNIAAMRWAEYLGKKWKISTVDIDYPRMSLTLGGLYNG